MVTSFPTNFYNHADMSVSYDYACSDTAMIAHCYMDEEYFADPFSASENLELGCAVDSGIDNTTCAYCKLGAAPKAVVPAVVPAEILTAAWNAAAATVAAARATQQTAMAAQEGKV